ncbi:MAG: PTS sugar transporter subunit IIA, partial [Victivallaceae bacterium]
AVKEYRCDLMMVGWSDKITLKSRIFGSFADNLLESCSSRMWFCRLKTPLNTCRRVILPLPEFGGRRSDFALLLRDVRQLSGQIGAELRVVVPPEISPEAEHLIQKKSSECRFELVRIEAWRKGENAFINELKADDILVLPLERRESVLWQPRFERFEDLAIARYPDMNVIAAYPQTADDVNENTALIPLVEDENQTILHGFDLNSPDISSAIEVMVRSELTRITSAQRELLSGLQEALRYHPLELSDSALLLHTRSEHVSHCTVLVGFSEKPYQLRGLKGEYKIIIALISPISGSQELHLCELANLARHFMNPELVSALRAVHSAAEVVALLKK